MKRTWNVIGVCAGALTLLLAVVMLSNESSTFVNPYTAFGADYYTESYQAMAEIANGIGAMHDAMTRGFAFLLCALGMFAICFFGSRLSEPSMPDTSTGASQNETEHEAMPEPPSTPRRYPSYGAARPDSSKYGR